MITARVTMAGFNRGKMMLKYPAPSRRLARNLG
jgi:hypothetical protein